MNIQQVLNATKARHHETFDLVGYYLMPDLSASLILTLRVVLTGCSVVELIMTPKVECTIG